MVLSDEERKLRNRKIQAKYRNDPKNAKKIKERASRPDNIAKRQLYRSIPKNKLREKARSSSYNRRYHDKKKDTINQQNQIRYDENRDEINVSRRIKRNKRYQALRNSMLKILGDQKCVQCGFSNPKALQIEHIHNTGNLDKKRFNRKDVEYRHYINHPFEAINNLQILCANCNQIKLDNTRSKVRRDKKYEALRNSLFEILGGLKCNQCDFINPKALQIDHIHNTGYLDKKRFKGTKNVFCRYYINDPIEARKNLQVLCTNCNQIKINRD